MAGVAVRLLGTIEVTGPLGTAELAPGRQRALVGLLALEAGRVVSQHRLVDALWGEDPPRTAIRSLQSYVARVRRALETCGLPDTLRTHDPGYVLHVDANDVDAYRFDGLRARARELAGRGELREAAVALRSSLDLWRAGPLTDGLIYGWGEAAALRLSEARLVATEELWEIELSLGHHGEALPELEHLAALHPTRERLIGQLMLAQHRSGRGTEALETYRRHRTLMIDELGVEPGLEVQRLHTAILQHDPAIAAADGLTQRRPAQLPPPVGYFVGRETQVAQLDRLIAEESTEDEDPQPVVVICGPAGIGKTSLVTQWARRHPGRFSHGQIFVDLRGHDPATAMSVDEAMSHLFGAMGLPAEAVPKGVAEQSTQLRSLLHDRRMLVVLDNAATTDQVLPMVPATRSCLLVVTSRNQLPGIAAHHRAVSLRLDLLNHDDSVRLLSKVLGPERTAREPEATARLAELCGHMPLALRIAAAKLAALGEHSIAGFAAELANQDRLDALSVEGDSRSLRAVLATAHRALAPGPALVFGRLGLHPGLVLGPHSAAALAGIGLRQARSALETLATAHLISEVASERYRFHDLVRLYAAECTPESERAAAIGRLFDWYLAVGAAANRLIDRGRDRVTPTFADPPQLPAMPDAAAALSFLDGEQANLVPVAACAAQTGAPQAAWQLAYLMVGFLDLRGHTREREEMWRCGLEAAKAIGDPTTLGLAHSGLGLAHIRMRRFDEGLRRLEIAMDLMRSAGDKRGEGHAHNNIALVHTKRRRFREAAEAFQRALEIHEAGDHPLGVALALNNLGYVLSMMDDTGAALEHLTRGLSVARALDSSRIEAAVLRTIGNVHHHAGDHKQALYFLQQALDIKRQVHDDSYQVEALNDLSAIHAHAADWDAAIAAAKQALSLARTLDDRHLESAAGLCLGRALTGRGDLAAAAGALGEALALRRRIPDEFEEALLYQELAVLAERRGDHAECRSLRRDAIALYESANAAAEAAALRG